MRKIYTGFVKFLSKIIGKRNLEKILVYTSKSLGVNLHQHGLLQIGAGTGVYLENGSEVFFIKNILTKQLENEKNPVLFDVGANIGNYSLALKEYLPAAHVYAFEPVKKTFDELAKNISGKANLNNIGFGNSVGKGVLYNATNFTISEIATTHKDILTDVFKSDSKIEAIEFEIDTIDNFCSSHHVEKIDFLKIDVEGNELAVLQGATGMLASNSIKIIQFEFNTHNVYSRVFLRDFYLLLKDFEFYRLKKDGMAILGAYNAANEIFTAQNIIAAHKTLALGEHCKYASVL